MWQARAERPLLRSEKEIGMTDCDIYPLCRSQGCTADPDHCQRANDIRARRVGNADAAAQARMKKFDENNSK